MEMYCPIKSRVRTSVSLQSLLPRCRATMSTNFFSGLFGAVKGAGVTGTGAQAVSGALPATCTLAGRPTRLISATASTIRLFFISVLSLLFWSFRRSSSLDLFHFIRDGFAPDLEVQAAQRAVGDPHRIVCR